MEAVAPETETQAVIERNIFFWGGYDGEYVPAVFGAQLQVDHEVVASGLGNINTSCDIGFRGSRFYT
jgi:hypothetical protein